MSVEDATRGELDGMPEGLRNSAIAASALALAKEMDVQNSATSKSMCAKAHFDIMERLRQLAPPDEKKDGVDELADRRAERLARTAGA